MAERPKLDLGNYLPYLINRVGFALVESFTADALKLNDLSIAIHCGKHQWGCCPHVLSRLRVPRHRAAPSRSSGEN